jgi:mannose-1-phosphate guanylyltransferase
MSNESRSKQFLKVLPDVSRQHRRNDDDALHVDHVRHEHHHSKRNDAGAPSGNNDPVRLVSMLQRVWAQIQQAGLTHHTYICSSRAQSEMIEAQLGSVRRIEEPSRRDTFPAISLATLYLLDVEGIDENEVVVVAPIDPYVETSYFSQVARLEEVIHESGAEIALMGVTPTYPTSKYGYIKVGKGSSHVRIPAASATNGLPPSTQPTSETALPQSQTWLPVQSFIEKPGPDLAERLIYEGTLWNCGVFAFRAGYMRTLLSHAGYPSRYEELVEHYEQLPKTSFDYAVVEKAQSVVVLPYQGSWKDLGTWETLCEEMEVEIIGKGQAIDCENTHILNELGIPVVAMGLRNAVVVTTPDGILVADKGKSPLLKDVIGPYQGRPMYEERLWGSYRVLDYQKLNDGTEVLTKCIVIHPGRNISYQRHNKRSEVWTVIEGTGQMAMDGEIRTVFPGDVVQIRPRTWHAIRAIERLTIIEVQRGTELVEEDIDRRFMRWEEIQEHLGRRS